MHQDTNLVVVDKRLEYSQQLLLALGIVAQQARPIADALRGQPADQRSLVLAQPQILRKHIIPYLRRKSLVA